MSDSEMADIPAEATISRALRDVVISIHKAGNTNDLTVKRVRARAEEELGLPSGFLKSEDWKQKSQTLIHEAVDKYCDDDAPEPSPPKKAAIPKSTSQKKSRPAKETSRGIKRKAAAPAKKTQKRRKTVSSEEELSDVPEDSAVSDAESELPEKPTRRQKKVVAEESDEEEVSKAQKKLSDDDGDSNGPTAGQKQTPPPEPKGEASDSDLSSLIDESPVKKKRQKSADKPKKETKGKAPKAKAKSKAEDGPDQAEIKRLQGWLVKCGIRKVWGKELAKCDTPKEKIKHLKNMLSDAGMEGKYSVEKAARIKEKREFAKDLEDIQAGAATWGKQDVTETGRPKRAANRPVAKPIVPVFSDDEEPQSQDDKEDPTDDDDDDDDDDVDEDDKSAGSDGSAEDGDEGDDSN
ncbi:hypothetical protein CC80DRAFT_10362 [Byssothecium circinans]|uniref:Transcriptional regulator n=1 Tax=Byssothecium circinans TaxID=147558 RepID=A0A6A5UFD2_9PLEO|nr:hypothetical protein CC80DRAFT_10362 [Byssothecium circinans]